MEIISRSVYVGPNTFGKGPLIRLTVDLHRRAETPVSDYADALRPLFDELPGLVTAVTETGEPLPERLKHPDCRLGELMAQVAVALQNRGGAPAETAFTRPAADADEVEVLYGYESEEIGLEAGAPPRFCSAMATCAISSPSRQSGCLIRSISGSPVSVTAVTRPGSSSNSGASASAYSATGVSARRCRSTVSRISGTFAKTFGPT